MTNVFECNSCGRRTFYKKQRCLDCGTDSFRNCDPGIGKIQAITNVHVTRGDVCEPNRLGLASFAGNANIIAQIDTDIKQGDSVSLVCNRPDNFDGSTQIDGVKLVSPDKSTK